MNSEWKEYKLGEVAEVQTGPFGSQLHMRDYKVIGTPIITVEHLGDNRIIHSNLPLVSNEDKNRLKKYVIEEGDIVFSRVGSVDRRSYVSKLENGWMFSGRCLRVRTLKSIVCPRFLSFYFGLEYFKEKIRSIAVGATMPSINTKILKGVDIYLPSLPEQKRIAEILSSLDDKIELNNKMNKNLEEIAQAIFKQWFVDFEFPDEAGNPYKSSGGKMIQSELGEIPEGWSVKIADELFEINIGKTPPRNEKEWFTENPFDIKWLSIKDLGSAGIYILNTSEYLTSGAIKKFNIRIVPKGSVVLSFKLTIGRVGIVNEDMVTNEAIAHFVIDDKTMLSKEFTYLYLKGFNYPSLGSTSSIATAVNSKIIKAMPILVPSKRILEMFNNAICSSFDLILKNQIKNVSLTKTRDQLLPKLMSGELRV